VIFENHSAKWAEFLGSARPEVRLTNREHHREVIMPPDESKRDPDQKFNPARPNISPGLKKIMKGVVDQLLDELHTFDQLHDPQFVAELESELEQEPDRKKAPLTIPRRSLERAPAATPMSRPLSKRLQRGKDCEEMADEIKTIRGEAITNGKAMFEIREAYPEFLVWNAAERLLPEDRAVFEMPTRWGAANGYANRFLSKVFPPKSPATVNDWRKEFRAHKKQNPA
jgi:hypothetical protein